MIPADNLDALLRELLGNATVPTFSLDWILNSSQATEATIRRAHHLLRGYGISDERIASRAHLLGRSTEALESTYKTLKGTVGLSDKRIATNAYLLGSDPETLLGNYERLRKLGIDPEKIAAQAQLLSKNPETVESNYRRMKRLGLSAQKIAAQPQVLGMNPSTVERNYRHHTGLLRRDYRDRESDGRLLQAQVQLLGVSPMTMLANVQYMHDRGIDYHKSNLLGTTVQSKRRKIAWMLRELFDYRTLPEDAKRMAVDGAYALVRKNARILTRSIRWMEDNKDGLREAAARYMKPRSDLTPAQPKKNL